MDTGDNMLGKKGGTTVHYNTGAGGDIFELGAVPGVREIERIFHQCTKHRINKKYGADSSASPGLTVFFPLAVKLRRIFHAHAEQKVFLENTAGCSSAGLGQCAAPLTFP